ESFRARLRGRTHRDGPPEGETGQPQGCAGPALAAIADHGERIGGLAATFVVPARAAADAAKVEADARDTELPESPRQRVDDFVVECAAVERMGMTDHAEPLRRAAFGRRLEQRLDIAGRAGNPAALGGRGLHEADEAECDVASSTSNLFRR